MALTRSDEQAMNALRRLSLRSERPVRSEAGQALRVWPMLRVDEKLRVFTKVAEVAEEHCSLLTCEPWMAAANDALEAQCRLFL